MSYFMEREHVTDLGKAFRQNIYIFRVFLFFFILCKMLIIHFFSSAFCVHISTLRLGLSYFRDDTMFVYYVSLKPPVWCRGKYDFLSMCVYLVSEKWRRIAVEFLSFFLKACFCYFLSTT